MIDGCIYIHILLCSRLDLEEEKGLFDHSDADRCSLGILREPLAVHPYSGIAVVLAAP